ncbi:hypothetical protein EAH73_22035 [Hymenobacter nivis]|uniref:Uncharacterized protein n=1 Tax=Hymenobacter nivis TaxID=1850093 RepID=A0A502GCC0_9BACT|nr:hypothetical protein EAH73_22035 [Hymenobacter nivis]
MRGAGAQHPSKQFFLVGITAYFLMLYSLTMQLPQSRFFSTTFPWLRLPSTVLAGAVQPSPVGTLARYRGWRVTFSPPRVWLDLAALRRAGYPAAVLRLQ